MAEGTIQRAGRWSGRHGGKDELRERIWGTLERGGFAVGDPWSAIPDFVGAEQAAARLAALPFWREARIVKCNPDRGQAWVRLQALKEGRRVYTPVPELTADFPFVLLDPERLQAQGIPFEQVMYSEGALRHGQRVEFEEMEPMHICLVGCVAVCAAGGRTGKGAGFADLEMGIFRELGLLAPEVPVVTTVHEAQVVPSREIVMQEHDTPLDWIVTPERVIETASPYPRPGSLDWDAVQADQYEAIPFLRELRRRMSS